MVSREPEAVTICCSFVPANWPRIACVTEVGGWMVKLYMNMLEVVAMMRSCQPAGYNLGGFGPGLSVRGPVFCAVSWTR